MTELAGDLVEGVADDFTRPSCEPLGASALVGSCARPPGLLVTCSDSLPTGSEDVELDALTEAAQRFLGRRRRSRRQGTRDEDPHELVAAALYAAEFVVVAAAHGSLKSGAGARFNPMCGAASWPARAARRRAGLPARSRHEPADRPSRGT